MPTRNRRHFVPQAIQYFLRQDYSPRELVILDDGSDAATDLVPADPRIRYVRLASDVPLGARRNIGCDLAAGELIAHWDDDDWYAPSRLSAQVHALLSGMADTCVVQGAYRYDVARGRAWQESPGVATGATLLYRRELWSRRPHDPDGQTDQARLLAEGRTAAVGPACYVTIDHPGKIIPRNGAIGASRPCPVHEVAQILGADADFYIALRTRRVPQSGAAPPRMSPVHVVAPVFVYDGLGSMGEYMALGMARAGASLSVSLLQHDLEGTTPELRELVGKRQPKMGDPTLVLAWWGDHLDRYERSPLFVNTVWETSRLPADWPARLKKARAIIVPTRFVADVFRSSGVNVPVEVVPQGIDPAVYHFEERPDRAGLTTLMVCVVRPRKNVAEGVQAWQQAFAGDPDARLVVKSRFDSVPLHTGDARIQFVDSNEKTRGIAHWYRQADVVMALGNEGFGLPLVEAMATGLPVIALNTEGQADVCEDAGGLVLGVPPGRWEPAHEAPFGDCGIRAIPDVGATAARLRWVAEHREEARALGREASTWATRHRDVWDMGPAILEFMETSLRPSQILRQRVALCCPDGSPALTRFARRLARSLPRAAVISPAMQLFGMRLLHIQHEPGLWDEEVLLRLVRQARYERTAVIVTEYAVGNQALAWEREADALVVRTEQEATTLTGRWPGLKVEVLPVACPPWCDGDGATSAADARVRARVAILCQPGGIDEEREAACQLAAVNRFDVACVALTCSGAGEGGGHLGVPQSLRAEDGEQLARLLRASADVVVACRGSARDLAMVEAMHAALASGVPLVAAASADLGDLGGAAHRPEVLADGVANVLGDQTLRASLQSAAHGYCAERTWEKVAQRHESLWRTYERG